MNFDDFRKYLESNDNIPNKQIPFFIRWAQKFIQFSSKQTKLFVPNKLIEPFLNQFGKQYEQWQVDQARQAINLYCYFLTMIDATPAKTEKVFGADWKAAGQKMMGMLRLKQRSYRTEQTYLSWLRDFYSFVKPVAPNELTDQHIINYLTYLAVERHVAKSTQSLAFNAILFFFRHVLEQEVGSITNAFRARRKERLPVVLTQEEVKTVIDHLSGPVQLMATEIDNLRLLKSEYRISNKEYRIMKSFLF